MQTVQSVAQGFQGFGQGGMGGGPIPAQLASDTTRLDPLPADAQLADDTKKDDEEADDETTKDDGETPPEELAEGAAAGERTSGSVPTGPPAAGQSGPTPSGIVL
jgi:hypothetical protein